MQKLSFIFLLSLTLTNAQVTGSWSLAPEAGVLKVGTSPGDGSWWSNSIGDVTTRACLFDDEYVLDADGSFSNVLGSETWLEGWQDGLASDYGGCGAPIAPHDGSNLATYTVDETAGTITIVGSGAFLGLAKANNQNETGTPNDDTIVYTYSLSEGGNVLTIGLTGFDGDNHWTYKLVRNVSSDDATLSSISVNNIPLSGFSPETTSYDYTMAVDDTTVPTISVSTANTNATYTIDDASAVPGTTTINTTSEDGETQMSYTINFLASSYVLVWGDEFENHDSIYLSGQTNVVDPAKWHHQTFAPGNGSWYNNEEQHYTNLTSNSYVTNGTLKIKAIKENYTSPENGTSKNYTSARLNSKYAFKYGRMEVRAKLPSELGTWPAIWTLGQNISEQGAYWQTQGYGTTGWPNCGEIDIMEQDSNKSITSGAFHFGPNLDSRQYTTAHTSVIDTEDIWHVYSMIWTEEGISLMVDGEEFHNTSNIDSRGVGPVDMSFFQANHFILLNVAMGGMLGGPIVENFSTAIMEIDYVRVYQPQSQPLSTPSISKNELLLYPNPYNGNFQIESGIQIDEVHIYNLNGQKLQSLQPNMKVLTINSNLAKGVYMVEILGSNFREIKRLMVK
jgi:beta-glucanase (GH16 family)